MELKRGEVAINKRKLNEFVNSIIEFEYALDEIMKEKESFERGRKIAQTTNKLTFARHAFQHFELKVDLKKLK